jgi:hypothetical protein
MIPKGINFYLLLSYPPEFYKTQELFITMFTKLVIIPFLFAC